MFKMFEFRIYYKDKDIKIFIQNLATAQKKERLISQSPQTYKNY
jgi:hypothetical protein